MPEYTREFEVALDEVLNVEGRWSDHEDDSGGKTKFGIIEPLARQYGYEGEMQDLSQQKAKEIYYDHFWDWMSLDSVYQVAPRTAKELFEAGVNIGRREVWRWLQRSLNVLNRQETDYDDISVDGIPGPETRNALRAFIRFRGETGDKVLSRAIDSMQGHHYITLAEARHKDESFVYGWYKQRIT